MSRRSLARGVTGGGEAGNGCCFINESVGFEGRGLGSRSCQGTICSDHRSLEIIRGHVAQGLSLGCKQSCNMLDVVVVHSCHKVAAMAALAYSLKARNRCSDLC